MKRKRSFLSPKHCVKFAAWNVQTLNDPAKGIKLAKEMDRYHIDILGISECRYLGSDRIIIEDKHVLYSGREDGRHFQGVALFCSAYAAKCLTSWEPVNERLLTASFKSGSTKLTIIVCYAPTEAATDADKDAFYNQLQSLLDRTSTRDVTIVMGDMNAKVGTFVPGDGEVVGTNGLGIRNDNGTRFVDLCQRCGLVIGGTLFPHKQVHKGTWRSPDGRTVNQIDHIAISRRHRSFLLDVRSFRGADIGLTDHYLVAARVRLKLKKESRNEQPRLFDVQKLRSQETRDEFRDMLEAKLAAPPPNEVNFEWNEWKSAMQETAETVLGRRRGHREDWISDSTWLLIKEKKDLKIKMESSAIETRSHFKELHRNKAAEVKRATRRDKRAFYHEKADLAESAAHRGDQRTLFKLAKELGGIERRYNGVIKDINGNKITAEQEKVRRWKEHFQSVLNCAEPLILNEWNDETRNECIINTAPFTVEEVERVLQNLKNNKSPGEDLITGEMCKAMGENGIGRLHSLINNIWMSESIPNDWKRGVIVKVPKKGDLSDCSNWRGITLLPVARKVLSNLIYNRLREAVDSNMREEQAGFRQDRGCSDQIFVLRTIIEECEEWKTPLVLNFIDFKKAFDSVHRPSMWKILESYGIPSKITKILTLLYEGSESCVRVGTEHTEWFGVDTGVLQGDSLSPVLFNIVLDFVMTKLRTVDGGIE